MTTSLIKHKYIIIEKKKGKYGIEYSLTSASDGPCPHGWGPTLKMSSITSTFPL